jgi:hypothetical protein
MLAACRHEPVGTLPGNAGHFGGCFDVAAGALEGAFEASAIVLASRLGFSRALRVDSGVVRSLEMYRKVTLAKPTSLLEPGARAFSQIVPTTGRAALRLLSKVLREGRLESAW